MRNFLLIWSFAAYACSLGHAFLSPPFSAVAPTKLRTKATCLFAAVAPPEALFHGFQLSGEDVGDFPSGVGVYSHADWKAGWRTAPEVDYTTTKIEGSLPAELLGGSLYRAGPARFDRGGTRYEHVLDGDGYVLKFTFPSAGEVAAAGGVGKGSICGVHVRGRFVETAWYKEEEASDELMYRNTFGTQPAGGALGGNLFNVALKNVANTNAQVWGDKLLACWEGGLPHALDPATLETLGPTSLGGFCELGPSGRGKPVDLETQHINRVLGMGGTAFTAHPHIDPTLNRFVGWGWTNLAISDSTRVRLQEWDENWSKAAPETSFVLEDCKLAPHDFAITPDFYVFTENRLSMDMAPYVLGLKGPAQTITLCPDQPVRLHVKRRPKSGPPDQSSYEDSEAPSTADFIVECPSWFCIHTSHATQSPDGRVLRIYSSGWPKQEKGPDGEAPEFLSAWGGDAPRYDSVPVTRFWKTEVELWPPTATISGVSSSEWPKVLSHSPWPQGTNLSVELPYVHPNYECGVHKDNKYILHAKAAGAGAAAAAQEGASTASLLNDDGATKEARYAFMSISNEVGLASAPQGWVRVDLWHDLDHVGENSDEVATTAEPYVAHYLTTRQFSEEVVLVPKTSLKDPITPLDGPSTSETHPSARVWLLGIFFDAPSNRSALAVLDGETMQREATIWLDHASAFSLHGSWQKPPE